MVTVKIKRLRPEAIIPKRQTLGDAGFDIHAAGCDNAQSVIVDGKPATRLYPGAFKVIWAGFAIEIPPGYEAQIRPRSGLAAKRGITVLNSPGTIDSGYRGEVGATLINHGSRALDIFDGDRIAQMVIKLVPAIDLVEAAELSDTSRGARGFGSTGVK